MREEFGGSSSPDEATAFERERAIDAVEDLEAVGDDEGRDLAGGCAEGLSAISSDAQKLYFSGRGHDLLVLTGDHKYLKTVALGGETGGSFYLLEE